MIAFKSACLAKSPRVCSYKAMFVSLNWLRDFVDLPASVEPRRLAERFTMTCAEVEGVERIEVAAQGLVAARIASLKPLPGTRNLSLLLLDVGGGMTLETVSAAPDLAAGQTVAYAPPGASTRSLGTLGTATVAGHQSVGMVPAAEDLGIALAGQQAVFLPPTLRPGDPLDGALFDDWVIEIDNKSITHRPDLWGHYGIAREVAAMYRLPLKPYPVAKLETLQDPKLPTIPIEIDDKDACPRYTGLLMEGVASQPAPLWMQLRLGHVGLRPIDCLVDLTNYVMLDLGQPMHAFDGDKLDRIEVGFAAPGSHFTTLDGVERKLPEQALMINCRRKPVALAGIMGGRETEVSAGTKTILLESANFDAAVIRRCAVKLGLRTDASSRFEKSLDPHHTVLAIQRFIHLARAEYPGLQLKSNLSDCYPKPLAPIQVEIDPAFLDRFIGHPVPREEVRRILTALEFKVQDRGGSMCVDVPSFRATKDIAIEADLIEEIARSVGFDNLTPKLPEATVRCFEPSALHELEQETLRTFCRGLGFNEIHGYLWYDDVWLAKLGHEPSAAVEVRNPITDHEHRLRHSLMPGLLAAVDLNRHHLDAFRIIELGSVYPPGADAAEEYRHIGLVWAKRQKGAEDEAFAALKGAIETWSLQTLDAQPTYRRSESPGGPAWQHEWKSATVLVDGESVGTISVVPLALRRRIDEHLAPWAVAWAELRLDQIAGKRAPVRKLRPIPPHPQIELDFSALADATRAYAEISESVGRFTHPLLTGVHYVGAFEGGAVPKDKRSLTLRTRIGDPKRTLVEDDVSGFRRAFEEHLAHCGLELRR